MTARNPRILVFQHISVEHPGIFRDFLNQSGVEWDAVELDEGESIPEWGDYDGLWVMGGPMDVWEEDIHPWLKPEKEAICEAVEVRKLPYLGVCLGHQLLADALGGEVGPSESPEVGIIDVELTPEGRKSPFLEGLSAVTKCVQWHSAEVKRTPPGAKTLVSSPLCGIQAMAVAETAFSLQYHVEITPTTVSEWGQIPAYEAALERSIGPGALSRFAADASANMATLNRAARRIYDNWIATAFG